MPDGVDGVVEDAYAGDAGGDPLQDSQPTDAGQGDEPQGQDPGTGDEEIPEAGQGEDTGDDGAGKPPDAEPTIINGTSFKDQAALVEGYKNIQRLVANKDREIGNLKQQVETALAAIKQHFGKTPEPEAGTKLPDGQELWNQFANDPGGTIQKFVDAKLQEVMTGLDPRLQGVENRVVGYERQAAIQRFLSANPEIDTEMEKKIADLLIANPDWMKQPDYGMPIAYNAILADEFRAGRKQASTDNAVAGAKSIAGLGGKKTSVPAAKPKEKDIFDDVLELDKAEQELYNLGKKE